MANITLSSNGSISLDRPGLRSWGGKVYSTSSVEFSTTSGTFFPGLLRLQATARGHIIALVTQAPTYKNIYYTPTDRATAARRPEQATIYRIPVPQMLYQIKFNTNFVEDGVYAFERFAARAVVDGKEYFFPLPNYMQMEISCDHLEEQMGYVPSPILSDRCHALIDQFWSNGFNDNASREIADSTLVGVRVRTNSDYLKLLCEMSIKDVVNEYAKDPRRLRHTRSLWNSRGTTRNVDITEMMSFSLAPMR